VTKSLLVAVVIMLWTAYDVAGDRGGIAGQLVAVSLPRAAAGTAFTGLYL